eukprot:364595-Chlamydomonas_euryale.AAC.19
MQSRAAQVGPAWMGTGKDAHLCEGSEHALCRPGSQVAVVDCKYCKRDGGEGCRDQARKMCGGIFTALIF